MEFIAIFPEIGENIINAYVSLYMLDWTTGIDGILSSCVVKNVV